MKTEDIAVLEAALGVFLRYGFKRTTMGDIAKAAGLSRQSLYARFSNKDEVFAAGFELYAGRLTQTLIDGWSHSTDLASAMDLLAEVSIFPAFEMLRTNPDAQDIVDGVETPEGKAVLNRARAAKCAALTSLFTPFADALANHGLTPAQLADFVESTKQRLVHDATERDTLNAQVATLKASVLALTS